MTAAILLALVAPAPIPAVPEPAASQEVVVTGRGLAQRPGDRAFDIVEIDRARIQANASQRLESVLADVAGLQQFRRSDSRSANPTSQGISLRGIGGNASSRALLILDGVPQADPFGGYLAFPAYATGRLGLIRVTRGGGSGYFGSGALAGTVELESATPGQLAPVEAGVAYGSRDSIEAQGGALLVRPGGFATLSAAYARGDGFTPTVAADRGAIDRPAPYRAASGAVRGVIDVATATELQANLSTFTDRRERGTPFTANHNDGTDASVRLVGRGRWGWSALAYLQARSFASQFAAIDAARTTATPTLDQYNTPATGRGARVELIPPLGEAVDLRVGGDARIVSGRTQELFTFVAGRPTRRREAGGGEPDARAVRGRQHAGGRRHADAGRADRLVADRRRPAHGARVDRHRAADRPALRRTDRPRAHRPGRAGVATRIGADAARGRLSRLAAADAERIVPAVPRGR